MSKTVDQLLSDMFSGVVQYVFHGTLGIVDPAVPDYISALLVRFIHIKDVYKLRTLDGHVLGDVTKMHEEALVRQGDARCTALQHVGDYALFGLVCILKHWDHKKAGWNYLVGLVLRHTTRHVMFSLSQGMSPSTACFLVCRHTLWRVLLD